MFIPQKLRQNTPLAFVYVPKTSGTYLNIKSIPEEKTFVNNFYPNNLPANFHMPASRVQSIVGEETPLFTLVRDPYDRTCSEYYFIKKEIDRFLKVVPWDINNSKRLEWMCIKSGKVMGEIYGKKTYEIYKNNMTVEDYLDWTTQNPTYPFFYDTKTPKDFDLVGQTEKMDEIIYLLKRVYNVDAGNGNSNKNVKKDIGKPYETKYSKLDFEKNNKVEYDMYQEGVDRFNKVLSEVVNSV